MAFSPTTWDPATAESSVFLSGDNLVYSTSNYYQNIAKTVASVTSGSWYWEIALDVFPPGTYAKLGARADAEEGALKSGDSLGGLAQGDVVGFHLDADIGSMQFYVNGAAVLLVEGLYLTPGFGWMPEIAIQSPNETLRSATANFGATAFAYPVPVGANAGFGVSAIVVDGIESEGPGSPTHPPIFVVFGADEALGAGTPNLVIRPFVTGIETVGAGTPRVPVDVIVEVFGIDADGAGRPNYVPPIPVAPIVHSVEGIAADGAGDATQSGWFVTALTGIESEGAGNAAVTLGCSLEGIEALGVGDAGITALYKVEPIPMADGPGAVSSSVYVFLQGVESPGAGQPGFFGASVHSVQGLESFGWGVVSVNASYPVMPLSLPPGLGSPILRPLPC